MKLSTNYTFAPAHLLDRSDTITPEQLRWYAKNCDKLATYMEKLPVNKHYQAMYVVVDEHEVDQANNEVARGKFECGTPACALGHAAWSDLFPGLQFGVDSNNPNIIQPVVNAGRANWSTVGKWFFGLEAEYCVFDNPELTKHEIVLKLRSIADEYRKAAHTGTYINA